MPTQTTNYNLYKPAVNSPTDQDVWGGYLNTNMDTIDSQMKTTADAVATVSSSLTTYAPLNSPTFTGSPVLPTGTTGVTQSPLNNSTKIATTKYVDDAIAAIPGGSTGSTAYAWCLFNGTTTGTNAPITGNNVTSITRNAVGTYTVNFTTPFSTANYGWVGMCEASGGITLRSVLKTPGGTWTTSSFQFNVQAVSDVGSAANVDSTYVTIIFFGS